MDGWSRPNHMPSHLDALQTMPSVDLRRGPGGFHSVAKQASFRVALRSDFKGFWSGFGTSWEAKMDAKINFRVIFFDVFFECVFASILNGFLEARNLKNHEKPLFFQWFLLIFTKSRFSKK